MESRCCVCLWSTACCGVVWWLCESERLWSTSSWCLEQNLYMYMYGSWTAAVFSILWITILLSFKSLFNASNCILVSTEFCLLFSVFLCWNWENRKFVGNYSYFTNICSIARKLCFKRHLHLIWHGALTGVGGTRDEFIGQYIAMKLHQCSSEQRETAHNSFMRKCIFGFYGFSVARNLEMLEGNCWLCVLVHVRLFLLLLLPPNPPTRPRSPSSAKLQPSTYTCCSACLTLMNFDKLCLCILYRQQLIFFPEFNQFFVKHFILV